MLRIFAKWWARVSYLFELEVEGAKNEINAGTAKVNADTKRKLVAQLNAEADAIEENIKSVGIEEIKRHASAEYANLTAQEKYEDERMSKKEKDAALQIVAEKRKLAEGEAKNAADAEQVAKVLRGRAHDSRAFADKIREL